MAQLVFVHGVGTRDAPERRLVVANRDALFRELLFAGSNVDIHSPMWGRFVPAIDPRIFEIDEGVTSYASGIGSVGTMGRGFAGGGVGAAAAAGTNDVISAADPVALLDAICSEIADRATSENRGLHDAEKRAFRKATDLIASERAASVFAIHTTPSTIASELTGGGPASFGIVDTVRDAATAVTDRIRNAVSRHGFAAIRDNVSPAIGFFLGDVFAYLSNGKARGMIQAEVKNALVEAHAASKAHKGPLIVVGHSLGGVILVDMLSNLPEAHLPEDLSIDALVTVGSQPGFFAGLGLLATSAPGRTTLSKPTCVRNWLNVFDPIDPLAFRANVVFAEVEDFAFNSVTGVAEAHTKYFQRPQFYARSRSRLRELKVL